MKPSEARRQLQEAPAAPPAPATPQKNMSDLAQSNYRVRRMILKAELDVYNEAGILIERGLTDDLVLFEADFPQAIMEYFISKGLLAKGFKTYKEPK